MPDETAPPDAEVTRMDDALDRGDHRLAGELARALASSDDAARREAGAAMLQRLRPDPVIVGVFIATASLLAAITLHWFGHR
jgi:hypothetical protein